MPLKRILLSACLALSIALPASASTAPQALAPLNLAHTFAQIRDKDSTRTLFVVALRDKHVSAVDLSTLSGLAGADAFDVVNRFTPAALDALARDPKLRRSYPLDRLLGVGPRGVAHIAAGTNYPAHGEETGVDGAFLFPKIAQSGGPGATVAAAPGALLDYEVEVCVRFDRELRSLDDFDAARKGFFVCGDYSDRATLMRRINLKNVLSGDGFPDAKSGPDRFPTGPFLVVPRDWQAFMRELTIETWVNGERRQQARARDMIKDLRTIVKETLEEAATRSWSYGDGRIPMVARSAIGTESAILTGTGEGVVFKEPGPEVVGPLMKNADRGKQLQIIDDYIGTLASKRIYLQPGNRVRYTGTYLGAIENRVVAPPAR